MSDNAVHDYVKYDLNKLIIDSSESDVSNESYQKLITSLGKLSVLINCAGESTYCLLPKLSPSHIQSTINLNLVAPIILSQLAYKNMLRMSTSKSGSAPVPKPSITNISSILSLTNTVLPGTSVYAALKAGLLGFTKSLSNELRGRVRVNAILPGLITETSMGALVNPDLGLHLVSLDEVVSIIVKSVMNENVNGECIIIDEKGERKLKTI